MHAVRVKFVNFYSADIFRTQEVIVAYGTGRNYIQTSSIRRAK